MMPCLLLTCRLQHREMMMATSPLALHSLSLPSHQLHLLQVAQGVLRTLTFQTYSRSCDALQCSFGDILLF